MKIMNYIGDFILVIIIIFFINKFKIIKTFLSYTKIYKKIIKILFNSNYLKK